MLIDVVHEKIDAYRGEEAFRSLLPEVVAGFKGNTVATGFNLYRSKVLDASIGIG